MATETVYLCGGRYYTEAGLANHFAFDKPTSTYYTSEVVEKHTITIRPAVAGSCTFSYGMNGSSFQSYYRSENGVGKSYEEADLKAAELVIPFYKRNGADILVYGAHPAAPGCSLLYTACDGIVRVNVADSSGRPFMGEYTVRSDDTSVVSPGLVSGSSYSSNSIVYDNSSASIWFGISVATDYEFYVFCGCRWFFALSSSGYSFTTDPNGNSRTVASGRKLSTVADVADFNSGSNASVSTQNGSLSFAYRQLLLKIGELMPSMRLLAAATATTTAGNESVLRGINTKADGSGGYYPVGADISTILTRYLAQSSHDTLVMLYGVWATRIVVTVNLNGGSGTTTLYYSPESNAFYTDSGLTDQTTAITPPTKASAVFLGLYATDSTSGTQIAGADGTLAADWHPTEAVTVYAQWRVVVSVTLDPGDGSGGTGEIQYDSSVPGYILPNSAWAISAIVPPRLECHVFQGYFSAASGGTKYIDADGTFCDNLLALVPSEAFTLYAQWVRVSYKTELDPCGGNASDGAVYCDGANAVFYRDDLLTLRMDEVQPPTRPGYDFQGYFSAASGGTKYIDADGTFDMAAFSSNGILYAQWNVRTYTITFNYSGGSGSEETKTVTWNTAIGTLPTPNPPPDRTNAQFRGWTLNGLIVAADTVWTNDGDAVLEAVWITGFSYVEDFFNLASSALVPIASTNGDTSHRVAVAHGGKYESGVNESGGIWRNPSVTYVVREDTTIAVKLGQAFPAKKTGNIMNVSGYMITTVEIVTQVGKFPTVTVSAVANEGANAVNNFTVNANKFNVSVPVVARSKAQNLLGAISGGGYLQRVALMATCDPVVCEENLMPCASDIVNGRYELTAETLAANAEDAPLVVRATGFALVDAPQTERDCNYLRYTVEARKEMV